MDFDASNAIQYFQTVVTKHYSDFRGRVPRKDFWNYIAVYVAVAIIVAIIQSIVGLGLLALLQLALFLPTAGITARRLQDTGRDGSLVWIVMIPVLISMVITALTTLLGGVGLFLIFFPVLWLLGLVAFFATLYMIYLCIQPGTPGANEYGPPPAAAAV
jgi:uncharacterized membrane protein YhaH (DUF805 family)